MSDVGVRDWIVVLSGDHHNSTAVYLGDLQDGCGRVGVRKLEHALRFTKRGVTRVASQYPVEMRAGGYVQKVTP